tara:strand:+ start:144 stop:575 length:432 start_codon:yes stop_codon:yes gene_type:complete
MLDKNKQLKFPDGSKTEVTIKSMGMEDNDFGSEYIVRIKETIDGYDHFKPSDGLKKKIAELNIGTGDAITIEKVAPSDKYQYGYFSVEMADNPPKAVDPAVHESPLGAGFAQKDDKMGLHELSLRVETLEKEVNELKKNALPF